MKAKKRTKNAEIPPATAWHPAARKLGEAVRFSFLRCIKQGDGMRDAGGGNDLSIRRRWRRNYSNWHGRNCADCAEI